MSRRRAGARPPGPFEDRYRTVARLLTEAATAVETGEGEEEIILLNLINAFGGALMGIWLELHRLGNAHELEAVATVLGDDPKISKAIRNVAERIGKEMT